jgi:hypothetical protein
MREYGGPFFIFLIFLVVAFTILALLLPVSFLFYLTVSHTAFQRRDVKGCVNCIVLGSALGFLNGTLQSFFGWDLSELPGGVFPTAQGALLGLSFFLFHRLMGFKKASG